MKKLLTAIACVSFLAACKKEEPAPVATEPVVVAPAETTTPAPVETMPPATESTEMAPAATTTPEPATDSSGSSVAGTTMGGGDGMYVVDKGDTLWSIAERNNISHGDLAKWNNINDPRELKVGQELRLTAP